MGKFDEWDNKITTFPGLYILSLSVHIAWRYIALALELLLGSEIGLDSACSTSFLRGTNALIAVVIYSIFVRYRRKVRCSTETATGQQYIYRLAPYRTDYSLFFSVRFIRNAPIPLLSASSYSCTPSTHSTTFYITPTPRARRVSF
jgi:DIE2/ALG10 family